MIAQLSEIVSFHIVQPSPTLSADYELKFVEMQELDMSESKTSNFDHQQHKQHSMQHMHFTVIYEIQLTQFLISYLTSVMPISRLTFNVFPIRSKASAPSSSAILSVKSLALLPMSVVSWNWSRTPRTSVPRSFARREWVLRNSEVDCMRQDYSFNISQLGTFVRAKAKVEELTNVIAEQRRH